MNRRNILKISALAILAFSTIGMSHAQKSIILSSTTSTEQSGLFKHLLPAFEKKTGIQVKVVGLPSFDECEGTWLNFDRGC